MAKLEIPSIVVQNGTKAMERTVRTQRSLTKQDEIHEDNNDMEHYEESSQCATEILNSKPNDEQPSVPLNNNTLHRSRSQNKVKLLVRSHAVREETSPPPDPHQDQGNNLNTSNEQLPQQQQPSTTNRRHKLRREGSSTETWEHPSLSRGNSREQQYDGSSQVDLHQFIVETLNRNHKDRMLLLKIESDLVALAKDSKRTVHKFAQMSSYQRMLVHRVAAYFSMEHNVDTSGVSVIVNTTKATRIPDTRFRDFVRDDLLLPEEPRRSILKRDSSSFDETGSFKSGERMLNGDSRRSKSFEEREEEYEKARRRIFNRQHSGDGDLVDCLDELHWENEDGICTQCDHPPVRERNPRLLKVESYECGETLKANSLRLSVSKSHSFSGYDPPQQTRILTKQDSGSSMSSRISPSSSGYKSQRSDATLSATPSPTATPNLHTQTGQPYTNADGSIYHYDPSNPPRVCGNGENVAAQVAQHVTSSSSINIPSSTLPSQQQQQQQHQQQQVSAQPQQQQQAPPTVVHQPQHQQKHGELSDERQWCLVDAGVGSDNDSCPNIGTNMEQTANIDKLHQSNASSCCQSNQDHHMPKVVAPLQYTSDLCNYNNSPLIQLAVNETENHFVKTVTINNETNNNTVSNRSFVFSVEKAGTTYFYTASRVDQSYPNLSPFIDLSKHGYHPPHEYYAIQEPKNSMLTSNAYNV